MGMATHGKGVSVTQPPRPKASQGSQVLAVGLVGAGSLAWLIFSYSLFSPP